MSEKNTHSAPAAQVEKSDVARREEEVLAFWNEHDIFNKSLEKESPEGDFVFYDGPPFATGLPHYGHILAGTIKDAIPRFWTMNGYHVKRKWGWDCHGLPLENIIEKRLGFSTKRDIEEFGIQQFNESARDAVMEYADDWKKIIPRMGRFVDMEDDYKTMDPTYTESVWWVFNKLHEKGLVYEGFKSMHLCPRCGTTLSNFEVNQGYKDIKDISVFVRLPLVDEPDTSLLVWTTTPWTLPGNMAAAVHREHDYVKAKVILGEKTEQIILAKEQLERLQADDVEVLEEMKGVDLEGKSYEPPFDYLQKEEFEGKEHAWKIYHADYVELGAEGTGAVHLAPAYGEEDLVLAQKEGVPIKHHVGEDGRFLDVVTDFAGQLVKPKDDDDAEVTHLDADIEIVKALNASGKLLKKENITHSYPHCWRCDTPLLNYATTSWFVEVTKIRDELVEENKKITWVPEHVGRSRFGKWLEGTRDWAVSRQRYWGAPLPIWRNPETQDFKVLGSLKEIREHVHRSGNTFFAMRHGESESNVSGFSSTKIDAENPVTENGKSQVADAIVGLTDKHIDLIIASPFQRTRETAEQVAAGLGMSADEIVYDERIQEVQLGEIDGVSNKEYHEFLDEGGMWCESAPEGGESWSDVKRRVGAFLYDIDKQYEGKRILIIAHNSPLRMLGAVNDGLALRDSAFDHDDDGKRYENAEVREIPFVPMPHNDNYELDYHRPYIDTIELFDEDGTKLERVPDVFDCWFESGSMPYAQQHYPFENLEQFDPKTGKGYPANFIAEGLDQTRGWFYSLIVLGTALFGKSPYQNVIVNGLVLAEDGKKMSKSLQNYPDPMELADRTGVDAMRFYLLSSPIIRAEDLNFSERGVLELQRKNIGRLHNVRAMYIQYAGEGTVANADSTHVLDRWILARLYELTRDVTQGFKGYELDKATRPMTDFIDDLSVWYLRRSRDRLKVRESGGLSQEVASDFDAGKNRDNLNSSCKEGSEADKIAALSTLKYVLRQLSLVMAPVMPFYAEYLYGQVREDTDTESVHLADWPDVVNPDTATLETMAAVRQIVTLALEARAKAGIKVRQPLQTLTVKQVSVVAGEAYKTLIAEEVNVKEVVADTEIEAEVVLDTNITPELQAEGDVREFMRHVQDARKKMGLQPDDRVVLTVTEETRALVGEYDAMVMSTVGAREISIGAGGDEVRIAPVNGTDYEFSIVSV